MSRRADRTRGAAGAIAAGLLVVAAFAAGRAWDRAIDGRFSEGASVAAASTVEACTPLPAAPEPRSESFAFGGSVVRAERWCGVDEVVVEIARDAADGGRLVVVAATSRGSSTLEAPDAPRARLAVGPDGWVAIAVVQADPARWANGGAWVTVTAGAPLR